jgi:hypothetical protein
MVEKISGSEYRPKNVLVLRDNIRDGVKVKAQNEENRKKSLHLLTWNNHIGEGRKGETIVDGHFFSIGDNCETVFVAIIFHHSLKDTTARIYRQKKITWKMGEGGRGVKRDKGVGNYGQHRDKC